ncbi:hypothetical protein HY635_00255 [Candidatus Uhrbacteria bacterium]|nr:hypothetical protein [Candidatus Uhrbacteria bacterium]
MQLSMRQSLQQHQQLHLQIAMPSLQWSLVQAFRSGQAGPPPFVPPTFEGETFEPRIRLERRRITDFESLSHVERMRRVDEANAVFRFAYTRGRDPKDGREKCYFKIPLLRDRNIMNDPEGIDRIKVRISRAEYERATAILAAVGEMERIARAIPYYGLSRAVTRHLQRNHGVQLGDIVLVSVDRGGRIPCLVLQRALGMASMETLKVDQGGGQLDEDRLREFVDRGTLRGKHALFVDSTVDSGRQIRVLERYLDEKPWREQLGHRSWSIVGSNECAENLPHHHNVNWGVDPDQTFEDNPDLMGIDYAHGTHTKVVERPSEASAAIRACLLAVPDGWIYDADDIERQIAEQRREWERRQRARRKAHRRTVVEGRAAHRQEVVTWRRERAEERERDAIERQLARITASRRWQQLVAAQSGTPEEALPESLPNGSSHVFHNVLIVGRGSRDLSDAAVQFVADHLGPHCSLFAGTPEGNPGAVLRAVLASNRVTTPEVRLYQPEHTRGSETFGGAPITFVGPEKADMRRQMIADSHVILALGGREGTLREVLMAIEAGKPTVLIEGYGPVPACVFALRRFQRKPNLRRCANLPEAVATVLALPEAA